MNKNLKMGPGERTKNLKKLDLEGTKSLKNGT